MIKKIVSENVEYLYVTDPLNTDFSAYQPLLGDNVFEKLSMNELEGIRMILTHNVISKKGYVYEYLYWISHKDLKELDTKINNDSFSDEDFENAIKVYYIEDIRCPSCSTEYGGFAVDHGNPYIGNKELLKNKIHKVFSNNANLKCPNCSSAFRITVLKLL